MGPWLTGGSFGVTELQKKAPKTLKRLVAVMKAPLAFRHATADTSGSARVIQMAAFLPLSPQRGGERRSVAFN
jgi:hypothetical protein